MRGKADRKDSPAAGMNATARRRVQTRLGYTFVDEALFERALTHRSAARSNNERLEFLGDAIIGFVVAEELYRRYPGASEGTLTRLRARVVRGESLAEVARGIALGDGLRLGVGVLKDGGRNLESILADGFEALIGAVYLDAGIGPARGVLLPLIEPLLERAAQLAELKDPKTRLQEALQACGLALPEYAVESVQGAPHARCFTVSCRVEGLADPVHGTGTSRRKAEQTAAARALERLPVVTEGRIEGLARKSSW